MGCQCPYIYSQNCYKKRNIHIKSFHLVHNSKMQTLYNMSCKSGKKAVSETEVDEWNLHMMFAMAESAVAWRSAAILLATRSGHEVPPASAVNAMT